MRSLIVSRRHSEAWYRLRLSYPTLQRVHDDGVPVCPPSSSRGLPAYDQRCMTTLGPLEAETCRDYVVPRLHEAGWSRIRSSSSTRSRTGASPSCAAGTAAATPLRADYLLEIAPGFPVAVVEAKREYRLPVGWAPAGHALRRAARPPARLRDQRQGDRRARLRHRRSRPRPRQRSRRRPRHGRDSAPGRASATTARPTSLLRPFTRQLRNSGRHGQGAALLPARRDRARARGDPRRSASASCSRSRPGRARRSWRSRSSGS